MNGFTFNGHHSSEFDILLESYTVGTPTKKKITVDVPYRNGSVDFSLVNTGDNVFGDRTLTLKINVVMKNIPDLQVKYNSILQWLIDTQGRQDLIFDDTKGYKFRAEVIDNIDYQQFFTAGSFTVPMIADPFRYGTSGEGSEKLWDLFNFNDDVMQDTVYTTNMAGFVNVMVYNSGKTVTPSFKVTDGDDITITVGSYTTPVIPNGTEYTDYNIKLTNKENYFTINGHGTAQVKFIKEAF